MDTLRDAVRRHAAAHADHDGLAPTPVPGLAMMCVEVPGGDLQSVYRPLVCLVLQGAKLMTVGREQQRVTAGQSVIVSADMPVVGRIVEANRGAPYLAVAVDLRPAELRAIAAARGGVPATLPSRPHTLSAADAAEPVVECVSRLVRLIDRPEAIPLLQPGIMRELHYWLLAGRHGAALSGLADPNSHASRLGRAIAILRADYRSRIPVARLAEAAGMSLTAFHRHFRHMTSLTPGQYQKRLRLIEARRLMLEDGASATSAAYAVGYESVSQFTREYGRLFGLPPKRDALNTRAARPAPARDGAAVSGIQA